MRVVTGVVIPARSENDTSNNPHNPIYGIARAGSNGEFVVSTGTRNSDTGGRSTAPEYMISPELSPTRVSNRNEAIGLSGGEADGFPSGRVAAATAILNQLKLGVINEAQATEELIQCGYDKSVATFNSPILASDLDPEADAILTNIFPNGEISNDGDFRKAAATMKFNTTISASVVTLFANGLELVSMAPSSLKAPICWDAFPFRIRPADAIFGLYTNITLEAR